MIKGIIEMRQRQHETVVLFFLKVYENDYFQKKAKIKHISSIYIHVKRNRIR